MWQLKQENFDPQDKVGSDTRALLPFYQFLFVGDFSQFDRNSLNLCPVNGEKTYINEYLVKNTHRLTANAAHSPGQESQ